MSTKKILAKFEEYQSQLSVWLVDHHCLPAHKDYQKFIILCNARTGSTMLSSLLSKHSQVVMFYELFHRHLASVPFNVSGYYAKSNSRKVVELRNSDPVEFLHTHVYKLQPKNIRAVGFKLLYPQARANNPWWNEDEYSVCWKNVGYEPSWSSAKSDLWSYLKQNKDVVIIHLKRENLLRSKISGITARATGRWGIGATGGIAESQEAVTFELDFEECLKSFEARRRMEIEADEFFADHRKLNITYEDLIEKPIETAAQIQDFLRLEFQQTKASTRKQATEPLSSVISNYNQLKEQFLTTPWSNFFED